MQSKLNIQMTLSGNTIAAENSEALRHSLSGIRYGDSISNIHRLPSDWMRALQVLSKEWRASALFAITVVAIVTCVTFAMKPVYESEGRLQIDPPGSEVFSLDAAGAGLIDSEYISTEAQKLQTDDLALATIRALHLDSNREITGRLSNRPLNDMSDDHNQRENAVLRAFQSRLSVRRDPSSRLVSVTFATHDPRLSPDVVNSLMKLLVERNFEARNRAIAESSVWLSRQLDDIREKMEVAMRTLADFGEKTGIADLDPSSNTYAGKMGDLNKELVLAQSERIQFESFLSSADHPDSLPQVRNSLVIQSLTQRLAEQNAQLAQSRVVYGLNHAEVRKLQNQVNELQEQIKIQRGAIVSELWTNYYAAKVRERLLGGEVKTATTDLTTLAQYNVLKKEAEADRDLYDKLYAKIKEAGIAAASKSSNVHIVNQARVLDHPTRPRRALTIMAGAVFGLVGGVALAFAKDRIQDRIRTIDDLRYWEGLPTVVAMPSIRTIRSGLTLNGKSLGNGVRTKDTGSRCFLLDHPNAPESEAVLGLRTMMFLSQTGTPPKIVLVTSPLPGEGKTTVANNLAIALAKYGSTCLVDADMRMPTVGPSFHVTQKLGLEQYLQGTATLDQILCPSRDINNLAIIPSPMPAEFANYLLTGKPIKFLIKQLRERFDFVVIDTPPIIPYTDGLALSTMVDGVILVGRAGQTSRGAISRGMELLEAVKSARILTVVLNAVDGRNSYHSYHD
jgi:capsular exopolysaccharide synthesis family protein